MPIAILDPFSGIAGDMTLGALIDVGLDADWLRGLPARLGLSGVEVKIREVIRGEVVCRKVDFDIPPQPHGRHIAEIRELVALSGAPAAVRARADATFTAIASAEGEIHGMPMEDVHLHEVGAVDAILDVVGAIWGFDLIGVTRVYCGPISVGDGTVKAAHGILPVPAPATLKLLEGHAIRPGPAGSGELVTPTGAALVRVLSAGPPPSEFIPIRSGFGAGTKDFRDRPNALRLTLAEGAESDVPVEQLIELSCDIDDMSPEYLAAVAERLRGAGALDVTLSPVTMKRGRPGVRLETLTGIGTSAALEAMIFLETTTIGVRRRRVERRALARETAHVEVLGHAISVKIVTLPDGTRRGKPEFADVERVALATGRPLQDIFRLAAAPADGPQHDPTLGNAGKHPPS
jgi:pyridinium-3,5-bisthiocarboxylic acid mononucleotide nickel chelatase